MSSLKNGNTGNLAETVYHNPSHPSLYYLEIVNYRLSFMSIRDANVVIMVTKTVVRAGLRVDLFKSPTVVHFFIFSKLNNRVKTDFQTRKSQPVSV